MTRSMDDLVITGVGAVTGAGDEEAFVTALLGDRSAVRPFVGDCAGLAPGYGAQLGWDRKELRGHPGGRAMRPGTMTWHTVLATGAVGRALVSAGLLQPEGEADAVADRRGIFLGSHTNFPELDKHIRLTHTMGSLDAAEQGRYVIDDARVMLGMKGFTGFDFLKLMNNMPTAHSVIMANVRGPANTFLGGSSSLVAVARAAAALRDGLVDQILCGGTGPGCAEGLVLAHNGHHHLASPNLDPRTAARPLDEGATGLVPGDAAVCFMLERASGAAARGVPALARLAGAVHGFAAPRGSPGNTVQDSHGLVALLRELLDQAGWTPGDVDGIAPAGFGLPELDQAETSALAEVFGPDLGGAALLVHTAIGGACEGVQGALSLLLGLSALQTGRLPPTGNLDRPRQPLAASVARKTASERRLRRVLVLSPSMQGVFGAAAVESTS